ncbi:MAG: hypothetical protein VYE73_04170, partial [Acidobacteriota bacterium]|nr:hypothetical protein [Acidobacteriota bacterium]
MLRHLHVRNLAVLAEASVEWKAGFNVLTGETGAGKSIVVDSLSLLAGARASADLIRSGAETLSVAGVFGPLPPPVVSSLDTAGVTVDSDEIVIRREINRAGRNRVYANDQPITLRLLSEVAPALLRIHGQREELGLAQPELQRLWLDRQGGDDARELLRRVARRFADYRGVAERLERMSGNDRIHQERIDLLTFQLGEIERVGLTAGEDDQLSQERNLLRNSEAVFAALGGLVQRLVENDGSVSETLAIVHSELDGVGEWEPTAVEWGLEVDELRIRAQELARTVSDRLQSIDADPTRLAQIEERLAVVERICHKYGPRSDDVLERFAVMRGELDELDTDAVDRGELEQRVAQALADYREVALELSAARAAWADGFCQRLADELAELALA